MRSTGLNRAGLMAALAIAAIGPGIDVLAQAMPRRAARTTTNRWPNEPRPTTALKLEIAEHNAAVEARNAAKRDRKRSRVR